MTEWVQLQLCLFKGVLYSLLSLQPEYHSVLASVLEYLICGLILVLNNVFLFCFFQTQPQCKQTQNVAEQHFTAPTTQHMPA